jgi:hypothetical protein
MQSSYLGAQIFGIGQLITQRKKLVVPEHQRDYAWTTDEVSQFVDDVIAAFRERRGNYFIGLIVLLGPKENAWTILDGQQRLATTTIIYSSIRQWLVDRNYEADAKQIDNEFLRARQLGGDYSPRLILNETNRAVFDNAVIHTCSDDRLQRTLEAVPKFSSNRFLLEAVITCREKLESFAASNTNSADEQKDRLFRLASFLENKIEAVVADVSSEANAYVIFESLNARGNDLSILDLLKNYVFGVATDSETDEVRRYWSSTTQRIEDKDADDFLKTFWTSRFGRVQSQQLYGRIKNRYRTSIDVAQLMSELNEVSEHYIALEDPQHEIWLSFGQSCRQKIEILSLLGSRQVRAPILSAIARFDPLMMDFLLESLIVLTIRYQIVGKRRTGALEIACARMANKIFQNDIVNRPDLWEEIQSLIPGDDDFKSDFLKFSEKKASRLSYLLAQLELTMRRSHSDHATAGESESFVPRPIDTAIDHIFPKSYLVEVFQDQDAAETWFSRIANTCLVENNLIDRTYSQSPDTKIQRYHQESGFILTRQIDETFDYKVDPAGLLRARQNTLADLAVLSWPIPSQIEA